MLEMNGHMKNKKFKRYITYTDQMATPVITACRVLNSVFEVFLSSYFVIFMYNYHHFYHYYKLVHEVQIETDNKKHTHLS